MIAASREVTNASDYEQRSQERYPALINADIALLANPTSTESQQSFGRKTTGKETRRKPVNALGIYAVNSAKQTQGNLAEVDASNDMSAAAAALEKFEENGAKHISHSDPNGTASLRARILPDTEVENIVKTSRGYSEYQKKPAVSILDENVVDPRDQDLNLKKSQHQRPGFDGHASSRGRFPIAPQQTKSIFRARKFSQNTEHIQRPVELVAIKQPVVKKTNRRSSIPILVKKNGRLSQEPVDGESESPCEVASSKLKVKAAEGDAFAIFEDARAYDGDDEATKTKARSIDDYKAIAEQNPFEESFGGSKTVQVFGVSHNRALSDPLEDISTVRRLSKTHPEHGATLTVSDHASSVIYGEKLFNGESNTSTLESNGNGLHRAVVTNELLKGHAPSNVAITGRIRPVSIHELESSEPSTDHTKQTTTSNYASVTGPRNADDEDPFIDRPASQASGGLLATSTDRLKKIDNNKVITRDSTVVSKVSSRGSTSNPLTPVSAEPPSTGRITPVPDHNGLQRLRTAQQSLQHAQRGSIRSPTPSQGQRQPAGFARPTSSSENRARNSPVQANPEPTKLNRPITPSGLNQVYPYPPRSSSLTPPDAAISGLPSEDLKIKKQNASTRSQTFKDAKSKLEDSAAIASSPMTLDESKANRISYASGKSMLSMKSLRGLFHKHDSEKKSSKVTKRISEKVATPISTDIHLQPADVEARKTKSRSSNHPASNAVQNAAQRTHVSEIAETTSLATQILNSARDERNNAKKERLLQMGKVMVDAITSARDAEVAMEQAKVAAEKAQMSYMLTRKSVMDVSRMVRDWKRVLEGGKL